jgi:hypothetical protein
MSKIRVKYCSIGKSIMAGKLMPSRKPWDNVTNDVVRAVIEKIGEGNTETIVENGVPIWDITVTRINKKPIPVGEETV